MASAPGFDEAARGEAGMNILSRRVANFSSRNLTE